MRHDLAVGKATVNKTKGLCHGPVEEGDPVVEPGHHCVPFGYQVHNLEDVLSYRSVEGRSKGFLASAIALVIRCEQFIEHCEVWGRGMHPSEVLANNGLFSSIPMSISPSRVATRL